MDRSVSLIKYSINNITVIERPFCYVLINFQESQNWNTKMTKKTKTVNNVGKIIYLYELIEKREENLKCIYRNWSIFSLLILTLFQLEYTYVIKCVNNASRSNLICGETKWYFTLYKMYFASFFKNTRIPVNVQTRIP